MRLLFLLALLCASACSRYRPIEASAPEPGQRIRIRFATTHTLVVRRANGDSVAMGDVRELIGPIISMTSDSIGVGVWSASDERGTDLHPPVGATARIARRDAISVEGWAVDRHRSKGLAIAIGATALGGLVLFAAYLHSLTT